MNLLKFGNHIVILDILKDRFGSLAYKVECNVGITYIRRESFKIIPTAKPIIENYDYLIPFLKML